MAESTYRVEMEKKLHDLNKQIEELKARADVLEKEKVKEFYDHLEKFNAHQKEVKQKLQEIDNLESEAQEDMKKYLDESFKSLSEDLEIRIAPLIEK